MTEPFPKPGRCEPLVRGKGFGKSGLKPAFSPKSKVVFPKLMFWENLDIIDKNVIVEYYKARAV
jgi:hypothetical protein